MTTLNIAPKAGFPELTVSCDPQRKTMNGKPVFDIDVKTVLNFKTEFREKLLCDGATFSLGSACAFRCAFCYVEAQLRRHPAIIRLLRKTGRTFDDIVIRRANALDILREQLTVDLPKEVNPGRKMVVFTSPLVDPVANMTLLQETLNACLMILELTEWDIRILSKSHLLPQLAQKLPEKFRQRIIFGVSTGTLDDKLASSFEEGTPLVSKRLASLHWLQDHGFRTFGMICPSLPQTNYAEFSARMAEAVRVDRCEHVWAEVINLRGNSFKATVTALEHGGFSDEAAQLIAVCGPGSKNAWEDYARQTFLAHTQRIPTEKLRFLQYVTPKSRDWWAAHRNNGAVLLGKAARTCNPNDQPEQSA